MSGQLSMQTTEQEQDPEQALGELHLWVVPAPGSPCRGAASPEPPSQSRSPGARPALQPLQGCPAQRLPWALAAPQPALHTWCPVPRLLGNLSGGDPRRLCQTLGNLAEPTGPTKVEHKRKTRSAFLLQAALLPTPRTVGLVCLPGYFFAPGDESVSLSSLIRALGSKKKILRVTICCQPEWTVLIQGKMVAAKVMSVLFLPCSGNKQLPAVHRVPGTDGASRRKART